MERAGFTLPELLASVAIVGFLSAIVLAGMGRTREAASNAACQGNLRQIYSGMTQYAADNDGRLPPSYVSTEIWPFSTWMYKISPYTYGGAMDGSHASNLKVCFGGIMKCPMNKDWKLPGSDLEMTSYSMNTFNPNSAEGTPLKLVAIEKPQRTLLVLDSAKGNISTANGDWIYGAGGPALRHAKKDNILFCDGHIESAGNDKLNWYLIKQN